MPLNDILLHLDSYADPTPVEAVDWAIGFAGLLQARLTALAVKARFPVHSNRMANYLIGLSGMARQEEEKSAAAAVTSSNSLRPKHVQPAYSNQEAWTRPTFMMLAAKSQRMRGPGTFAFFHWPPERTR